MQKNCITATETKLLHISLAVIRHVAWVTKRTSNP